MNIGAIRGRREDRRRYQSDYIGPDNIAIGAQDTATVVLRASGDVTPPEASFSYSCDDLACEFDASGSSSPNGSINDFDWDFGDGSTDAGSTVDHSFSSDGSYTVTLTIEDSSGETASSSRQVAVDDGDDDSGGTDPGGTDPGGSAGSSGGCSLGGGDRLDSDFPVLLALAFLAAARRRV